MLSGGLCGGNLVGWFVGNDSVVFPSIIYEKHHLIVPLSTVLKSLGIEMQEYALESAGSSIGNTTFGFACFQDNIILPMMSFRYFELKIRAADVGSLFIQSKNPLKAISFIADTKIHLRFSLRMSLNGMLLRYFTLVFGLPLFSSVF